MNAPLTKFDTANIQNNSKYLETLYIDHFKSLPAHCYGSYIAISIKVVLKQIGKVEYGRERLPGIAMKIL